MPRGFFVTGTDTNVGKTVLSAVLCSGLSGVYWKPIQTGASEGTDRRSILSWTRCGEDKCLPERFLFNDPVSPHLAAQRAGVEISLETIEVPCLSGGVPLVAEGAGGVMVPIMTDLMRHLGFPVILASRSTLGTINHTLLSLRCLRDLGIPLCGVVLIGPLNPENRFAIEHYGSVPVIGEIPPLEEINPEALRRVFVRHFVAETFQ